MAGNNHGHTLAAWTGVTITCIGFCIGGACTVVAQPLGVAAGCAVALLGGVVGLAMRAAGLGQKTEGQRQPQVPSQSRAEAEAQSQAQTQAQAPAAASAQS